MNWLSPHLLPAYKVVSERTFQWAGEQLSDGKSRNQEELERNGVNTGAGLLEKRHLRNRADCQLPSA